MFKNVLVVILCIFLWTTNVLYSQAKPEESAPEESIKELNLDWPFDRYSGFRNYAQELVFYRDKGYKYLEEARKYYLEGYKLIERYKFRPEQYDHYERDPYKVEAGSPTELSMRQDFALAEVYFTRALDISARYMDWDPKIKSEPLYQSLIQNCFKNVIYTSVYNGNFNKAWQYLNEYKNYAPDEAFVEEWGARIFGNLVKVHEKYDWVFVGKLSAENMRREHKEMLTKLIEKKYSADPKLMEELKKRIYPEYVVIEEKSEPEEKSAPESSKKSGQ